MENGNKELDLFELINRGFGIFKNLIKTGWNVFLSLIKFHVKNIFILLPFIIIGVSIAIYQTQKENRKQYAEFMLQINGKTNSYEVSDILKVLSQTINPDTSNVIFAKTLNLDTKAVEKVYSLKSFFVIDLNNNKTRDYIDYANSFKEDTSNSRMNDFLDIRISSKGEANYQEIQQKIVDYLMKNPYLISVENERMKAIQERMQTLNIEIAALDSMRDEQLKNKNNLTLQLDKSSILLGKESSYYKEMLDLKGQKSTLQAALILQPNVVSVYSGVEIRTDETTTSIFLKYIGYLYVLGLFIAMIIYYRKKIKSFLKD